ncbi:ras-related protein rab-5b-related [Anaeramoeba flamelloides]|uniref:Ras-related protein rab-5b-related n=1 Tax=Anaeramoeba flamelloides TaxID=1746091 RepID=A0AAV7ZAQ7_9EUKA|nr:ras-related protein rab-5b-related [Anaeramoeba flamelloides]
MSKSVKQVRHLKIVLLGDEGVGKTSIALRYTSDFFQENYKPTVGAAFHSKSSNYNGTVYNIKIWDTAGQERFKTDLFELFELFFNFQKTTKQKNEKTTKPKNNKTKKQQNQKTTKQHNKNTKKTKGLSSMYYKDCDIAILVYDITSKSTFKSIGHWERELRKNGPQDVQIAIVGNKIDLPQRSVKTKRVQMLAENKSCHFFETSAKEGTGIKHLFKKMCKKVPNQTSTEKKKKEKEQGKIIKLIAYDEKKHRKKCCRN